MISKITGKEVESDLTLKASGGATVEPTETQATPGKPGKVDVKMPSKPRSVGTRAAVGRGGSVGITGVSQRGRVRGSIGSDALPERFSVKLQVRGRGVFATHETSASIQASISAERVDGDGVRWQGSGASSFSDLSVGSKLPECTYGSPDITPTPIQVTVTANESAESVEVVWATEGQSVPKMTYTVTCIDREGRRNAVPGQPGPALIASEPTTFSVPINGGSQPIANNPQVTLGSDGFFHAGTLTITPEE